MEHIELEAVTWNGRARPITQTNAQEMAAVGIIPLWKRMPVGSVVTIAGQPFVVTGPATREEFLAKAKATFPEFPLWDAMPLEFTYHHVSTD